MRVRLHFEDSVNMSCALQKVRPIRSETPNVAQRPNHCPSSNHWLSNHARPAENGRYVSEHPTDHLQAALKPLLTIFTTLLIVNFVPRWINGVIAIDKYIFWIAKEILYSATGG